MTSDIPDLELDQALGLLDPEDFDPAGILGADLVPVSPDNHPDLTVRDFVSVDRVLDEVDNVPQPLGFLTSGARKLIDRDDVDEVGEALGLYLDGKLTTQAFVSQEYGPAAMFAIYPIVDAVLPSMEVSGIVGDRNHGTGYHRCRAGLPDSDYSVRLAADKLGDKYAASAIDLKFSPRDMKLVSARLMAAFKARDPRVLVCREFYGTLNGTSVTGWNLAVTPGGGRGIGYVTADASHLWHVHISILRKYANDKAAMRALADVICGVPAGPREYLPTYVVDPAKVTTTLIANGRNGKPDRQLKPGTRITDGLDLVDDGGRVWLVTESGHAIAADHLVRESDLPKTPAPANPAPPKPAPAYLPAYVVDPDEVDTFLYGVNDKTGATPVKASPGTVIDDGVSIVERNGKKWLLTARGIRFALPFLVLRSEFAARTVVDREAVRKALEGVPALVSGPPVQGTITALLDELDRQGAARGFTVDAEGKA